MVPTFLMKGIYFNNNMNWKVKMIVVCVMDESYYYFIMLGQHGVCRELPGMARSLLESVTRGPIPFQSVYSLCGLGAGGWGLGVAAALRTDSNGLVHKTHIAEAPEQLVGCVGVLQHPGLQQVDDVLLCLKPQFEHNKAESRPKSALQSQHSHSTATVTTNQHYSIVPRT